MFDISSDIIIPNFEMLENNGNDYYYYGEMETIESAFDDYETAHIPAPNPMLNNYQPVHVNNTSTPMLSSSYNTTDSNLNSLSFNSYPNMNLMSEVQDLPKFASPAHMNHMSVNVNLLAVNETSFLTPTVTPQIQSPNNLMYPYGYDVNSGNSYHDYAPGQAQYDLGYQQNHSALGHSGVGLGHPGMVLEQLQSQVAAPLTQYQLQQHQLQQQQLQSTLNGPAHSPSSVTSTKDKKPENKIITSNSSNYRIVRGIAAGGSTVRPPKVSSNPNAKFLPIELNLIGGTIDEICRPQWNYLEKEDQRRIVRIERIQKGPKIIANFSIVGSASENPTVLPPAVNHNIDVIEVSCLQCSKKLSEEEESDDTSDDTSSTSSQDMEYDYYITSVEVIEIVELLIRNMSNTPSDRRKERGRVRSNLVPFWSKKPISSRLESNTQPGYRIELAKRIMSYEIRKPRGFDKEVRILRWDKLIPALKRALQCYYCEIPESD